MNAKVFGETMLSPCCGAATKVVDMRSFGDNEVRRRRECKKCGKRFSTKEEIYEYEQPRETKSRLASECKLNGTKLTTDIFRDGGRRSTP